MARLAQVDGTKEVKAELRAKSKVHAKVMERRLHKAGLYLFRCSQKLVPIETGNLRGSGHVRREGQGWDVEIVVYYTAKYAVWVHENLDAAHGEAYNIKHRAKIKKNNPRQGRRRSAKNPYFRRGAKQQAKFLETPLRTERQRLQAIIKGEA